MLAVEGECWRGTCNGHAGLLLHFCGWKARFDAWLPRCTGLARRVAVAVATVATRGAPRVAVAVVAVATARPR